MLVHDCDLRDGLHAKRWFDAVGHYSREEVLTNGNLHAVPATDASTRPARLDSAA